MGKDWDKSGIAYSQEVWELYLQILKPGGHLLAFGGARTYHRMACAIEDAGFEIRDCIMWIYGSGFPKSLDVSKAIDKQLGAEREKVKRLNPRNPKSIDGGKDITGGDRPWLIKARELGYHELDSNLPASNDAKRWQGWGTALKPAHEPIVLARKPLDEKTIAANVLMHGTGAINIDGCRVATSDNRDRLGGGKKGVNGCYGKSELYDYVSHQQGRFPANLIHDGSEQVEAEFANYGERKSGGGIKMKAGKISHGYNTNPTTTYDGINYGKGNCGSASRFYYCAKASKKERNGSKHPTVKPLALMRYLCRLITPPGGIVLDAFAGSGTTGQAAIAEGFKTILIEQNQEYVSDIKNRLKNYGHD